MRTPALLLLVCLAVACKRDNGPKSVSDQWRLLEEQPNSMFEPPAADGTIEGIVEDPESHQPIENAIVSLSCTCLDVPREVFTNVRGIYVFQGLPAGDYTVTVHAEPEQASRSVTLEAEATRRVNFAIEPTTR